MDLNPEGVKANGRGDRETGTLGKLVALLDRVALADGPMRFTDILSLSDQPRGTLHRQLSHLVEEGLLEVDRDGRYLIGLRLLTLASRSWARNEFRAVAEPHLQRLHDVTCETVHLGVLHDAEVIYLDKVEGRQSVRMYSQIGNASPAYCTGVGKAALSALDDAELAIRIAALEFRPYTQQTLRNAGELLSDISEIRQRGYAFDIEEHESGICCVAAPIRSDDGHMLAGVSVTGPAYRVTPQSLQAWAPLVVAAADSIMMDMRNRMGPKR
ncbi:IclR family transcriptional regulator [Rhizobium sp. P40RR-XXII]|uniref:IclR family transcriptional regulator n=1 Tax=unclassified Rhizobium TaxID=2613769 RepID=UPI0014564988|nr:MULTISPECIES: IclR family transcriptional regulator [unclassified Rhizobium]NLR87050.1 IclR family transcriptional regulator [Rhizobium sp. P28RR-XV]NLS17929.1 IclR family transcriptional regulator [Rhizobium sp. P40RR-XXII]